MKRAILSIFLLALPVLAAAQTFTAALSGAAEVPAAGDPDGSGVAAIAVDGTTLHFTIFFQDIGVPTAAHIHAGAAGQSGGPVIAFPPSSFTGSAIVGSLSADAGVLEQIAANPAGFYVNVHTAEFPDGAIRGQLSRGSAVAGGDLVSYIPVAGRAPGANETLFVTDLRIVNLGGSPASVTLEWWPAAPAATSPAAVDTLSVEPGQQAVIDDVLQTSFGLSQGLGAIRLVSDAPISASARILDDQRPAGEGTSGFAFEARPLEQADSAGILPFLSNASDADRGAGLGFRTNLGYFNPNGGETILTIAVRRSSDGSLLGSKSLTLGPFAVGQPVPIFSVVDTVAPADRVQNDFYVTWEASGPLFVYASVTDNRTGDGVFVQ